MSSIASQQSKATGTVSATEEGVPQDQPLDLSSKRDTVTQVIQEINEVTDLTDIQTDHEITPSQIKIDIDFQVIADDIQIIQDDAVKSQEICQQIARGKYFPVHLFDNIQPQEVHKITEHLEVLQLFQVKTNIKTWHRDTSDLCHFKMHSSRRQGFGGISAKEYTQEATCIFCQFYPCFKAKEYKQEATCIFCQYYPCLKGCSL